MARPKVSKPTAHLLALSIFMIISGIVWWFINIFGVFHPVIFVIIGVIIFILVITHQKIKEHIHES